MGRVMFFSKALLRWESRVPSLFESNWNLGRPGIKGNELLLGKLLVVWRVFSYMYVGCFIWLKFIFFLCYETEKHNLLVNLPSLFSFKQVKWRMLRRTRARRPPVQQRCCKGFAPSPLFLPPGVGVPLFRAQAWAG